MRKKTLITGGAGFIGFHLAKHLANQNHEVTILDNFARGKEDLEFRVLIERGNVNLINGDITKAETFDAIKPQFDFVYLDLHY